MTTSRIATSLPFIILIAGLLLATRDVFRALDRDHGDDDDNMIKVTAEELEILPLVGAVGPESIAFDPDGQGPYVGVSDGRILRWDRDQLRWTDFAVTSPNREGCDRTNNHEEREHICGRPLGLRFNKKTGDLYIADAYMGLLSVGRDGGLATPIGAQRPEGVSFWFTNALDIDHDTGDVYFTVSSTRYPRRRFLEATVTGDDTGMLMKYDPTTKTTTRLLSHLNFANGVSLGKNGDFVLALESTQCRVHKYWLKTSKAGTSEVVTQLPGFPDNIKMNSKGEFWVGIYSRRSNFLEWILSFRHLGEVFVRLPFEPLKLVSSYTSRKSVGMALKLSEEGDVVLQVLEEKSGRLRFVSEAVENERDLWFGSVVMPFVCVFRNYQSHN
ncbi:STRICTOSIDINE SYNTHASE-LIKE 10-like protein [Drosera capensis]